MSKAKVEKFEIVGRRLVPDAPGWNFRGQFAVCVKLQSGFMAWGFSPASYKFAEKNAVKAALKVKNG